MLALPKCWSSRRNWLRIASSSAVLTPRLRTNEPQVNTPPFNTLSEQQETALRRNFALQYGKKVEILRNPAVDTFLNGILKKLGNASQKPSWPYRLKVVNSYLQRGLLEFVEDENEMVAAFLARTLRKG